MTQPSLGTIKTWMNVCRYQTHWRLDSNDIHIFDLMIESSNWSLVLFSSQCHDKLMKSKVLLTHKHNYLIVGLLTYLCLTLLLEEKPFCILENELNIIEFSKMTWKLVHMACGSSMHIWFQFSEFLRHFWAIYEFSWFYYI